MNTYTEQAITSRYNTKIITAALLSVTVTFMLSLALLQVFAAAVVIMWLTEKWEDKKHAVGTFELVFLAFVGFRLISVFLSPFPASSYQSLYKDALFYLSFLPFSFYFRVISANDRVKIADAFVNISAVVAVIGIVMFTLGLRHRAASIVSGYATFSAYLVCALAMLFYADFRQREKKERLLLVLKGGAILTGLVLSLGRTELGIAVMLVLSALAFRKVNLVALLAMGAITVAISLFAFSQNDAEVRSRIANPSTMSDRDIIWGEAANHIFERPFFGFGPRTFKDVFTRESELSDKQVGGWHDEYISTYIESGIFALLTLLALISMILYQGGRRLFFSQDQPVLLWGLLFALGAMFASAVMSGFITSPILSVLFNYLIGMFISQLRAKS